MSNTNSIINWCSTEQVRDSFCFISSAIQCSDNNFCWHFKSICGVVKYRPAGHKHLQIMLHNSFNSSVIKWQFIYIYIYSAHPVHYDGIVVFVTWLALRWFCLFTECVDRFISPMLAYVWVDIISFRFWWRETSLSVQNES